MAPRLRSEGEPAPNYGPHDDDFTLEVDHSGFLCGDGNNRTYVDGKLS